MIVDSKRLLSVLEAAEILSVCERTVHNLTKRGQLPSVRVGRALRYDPAQLQKFIEQQSD